MFKEYIGVQNVGAQPS